MAFRKKVVTYRCFYAMPRAEEDYVELCKFRSEIDECYIIIWLRHRKNMTHMFNSRQKTDALDIRIDKITAHTPAKVDIKLHITSKNMVDIEETESLDAWMKSYEFHGLRVPPSSIPAVHTLTLKINWFISKSPIEFLHISDFLLNNTFSDVEIIIGGEKLPVHKVVLASASPVIMSMLLAPMKEAEENRIVVEDVEIDVMKAILRVLYTGKEDALDQPGVALAAAVAAEKYDMGAVKELCEQKLLENLTGEDALEVLDVADDLRMENLRKGAIGVAADQMKEILGRENCFETLCVRKPLLVKELMTTLVNRLQGL